MSRPASPAGVLRWTLATLLSHWWRSPIQLAALVVGLSVATALWSGVQALNAEARASYDRAAEAFGSRLPRLEPVGASRFDQSAYVALRRAGWPVTPVLEGTVSPDPAAPDSAPLRLIGIDPLTMPAGAGLVLDAPDAAEDDGENGDGFAEFILPPHRTYAAAETMRALGLGEGAVPRLADGPALPPLSLRPRLSPGLLVVDVGAAQTVLQAPDALSYLLIAPGGTAGLAALKDVTDIPLRRSQPEGAGDLDRLTESFHMNLTAFGLLAFLVGLFIVNAAIGLAFEQRRTMFRTLRATGVSAGMLAGALGLEMVVLALGAGLLGLVGGYGVAAALLPDVAASLRGLYGADVPGSLGLRPGWWAAGLAMSVAGAMLAAGQSLWRAYTMPLLAAAGPQAWAEAQRRWLRRQGLVALGVALVALALPLTGLSGLMAGFGQLAGLLLAAALLLPVLLAGLLGAAERLAAPGLGRWFWADSRQQLPGLSLALMALLLALGVNIGVGTMVGSFRATFTHWLDDRLAAEVYFRAADTAEARRMTDWLEARDEVAAVLPNWRAEARLEGWPVDVYGFTDDPLYRTRWPLLAELPQVWDRIAAGEAALVSEQLAYRLDLAPGERIALPGAEGRLEAVVGGIYADYGNPKGQMRVDLALLLQHWPDVEQRAFGVRLDGAPAAPLVADMRETFGLGEDRLRDNETLKALSLRIFERTFVVTGALNTLTLGVAGIALLTSLVTLSGLRLPSLAPVWALGVTRRSLGLMELGKMLALALFTGLIAIPLGLGIAWMLVAVINVEAFGWRLPLTLFPLDWARLLALAVLTAGLAAALPLWRLARMAPARLVAVFASAR